MEQSFVMMSVTKTKKEKQLMSWLFGNANFISKLDTLQLKYCQQGECVSRRHEDQEKHKHFFSVKEKIKPFSFIVDAFIYFWLFIIIITS